MKPTSLKEFGDYLIHIGFATSGTLIPCDTEEVDEIRVSLGVNKLPEQYESFLKIMGRQAGTLLPGTDFFFPSIVELMDEARELLVLNNGNPLMRPGSLIIGMHGGYQLYWLEPGEPSGAVCFYSEVGNTVKQNFPSLLDFLVYEAERELELRLKRATR